jgi:hypothetical protein
LRCLGLRWPKMGPCWIWQCGVGVVAAYRVPTVLAAPSSTVECGEAAGGGEEYRSIALAGRSGPPSTPEPDLLDDFVTHLRYG